MKAFSLISFSSSPNTQAASFTSDPAVFRARVENSLATADTGATNYRDTLDEVKALITSDITKEQAQNPPVASTYMIVFLSDGFPIEKIQSTEPIFSATIQQPATIIQRVAGIMALAANTKMVESINLFTGYYYNTNNRDQKAADLLQAMADRGNGLFYEFGGSAVIDFNLFTVPSKVIRYNLSGAFVHNASVVWKDGRPVLDSDTDGISDEEELELGSNPYLMDSDGDRISDFVELIKDGSPIGGPSYASICAGIPTTINSRNEPDYVDTDKDGLDDCEERILGNAAGVGLMDSNGDGIPDWLALKNGIEFKAGTNPASGDPDFDGMSNFNEIKLGLPPLVPNFQVNSVLPMHYQLKGVSSDADRECFSLKVQNVNTIGSNNVIQVYLMEKSASVVNEVVDRVAEKSFDGSARFLLIEESETGAWR